MTAPDPRLYAAAIALVSGIYSVASSLAGPTMAMPMEASVMLVIGVVVIVHGILLLTPLAARLGNASGPLMVLWAAVMLANQLVPGMTSWDGGMVALAVLMLASGAIMSRSRGM